MNIVNGQLTGEWYGVPTECINNVWQYTDSLVKRRYQVGWFGTGGTQTFYIGSYTSCQIQSWQPWSATSYFTMWDDGGIRDRNWYVEVRNGQALFNCYNSGGGGY